MSKASRMPSYRVHTANCLSVLRGMDADSVDLTFTSPPYCVGKAYEPDCSLDDLRELIASVIPELHRVTKPGGSICWQVGYFIDDGKLFPLDYLVHGLMSTWSGLILRNRIVWRFGHGLHCQRRFSGRHETVLWYTKGDDYNFYLDEVRIPQKYPGKRHHKGKRKGKLSGHPYGKNPEDVWLFKDSIWSVPNVKANHCERTEHPCQFPIALPHRFISALTRKGGMVFDPFCGAGTTGCAAVLLGRSFVGVDKNKDYTRIARSRLKQAATGKLKFRDPDMPVYEPTGTETVAKLPASFKKRRERRSHQE